MNSITKRQKYALLMSTLFAQVCPSVEDECLTKEQMARYPKSTGSKPVVQ